MEEIPFGLFDGLGVVGVVILVGWLIMTGRLVPRKTHEDSIHEANEWRTESRIKDQQIAEKDTQLRYMAEVGRTVDSIMRAMPHTAGRDGD